MAPSTGSAVAGAACSSTSRRAAFDAKSEHTRKRQTNLALSSSSSPSPCSEGSSACAVRELTHTPRASLAVPPEELGEETLEEDEVDVEDLATGAGPGVPGEERRRTTL